MALSRLSIGSLIPTIYASDEYRRLTITGERDKGRDKAGRDKGRDKAAGVYKMSKYPTTPNVTLTEWIDALKMADEGRHNNGETLQSDKGVKYSAQGILASLFVIKYPTEYKWTKKGKFKGIAEGCANRDSVFEIVYTTQVDPTATKAMQNAMSDDVHTWEFKGATFAQIADRLTRMQQEQARAARLKFARKERKTTPVLPQAPLA
jgi:hypothetical protein